MQAHIVLAHPEPKSYNGYLAAVAQRALADRGWGVTISDLYEMGFDPAERPRHYPARRDAARFDTQAEQRHASESGTLPPEIAAEIERLDSADLVILQYPMWWHLPPAMLKGWFDRVLAFGEIYGKDRRFETGRFVGKRAMVSVTVGTSRETYAYNGRSGDIDLLLWPVHFTLAYVGFDVLAPHVAYGVESAVRYSAPEDVRRRLDDIAVAYAARLRTVESETPIPFNRMSEWGRDGRIVPDAPVHSPFIRHREHLDIG